LTKLIYIGGYGRSGSTLLEYLLATHPEVVACGEVERHLRRFGRRKICTCRQRMQDCPVWSPFQHTEKDLKGWSHEQLTLALLDHVSRDYSVMVDSSKTAWRSTFIPIRLRRKLGADFLLVHIVRDPRGVSWSAIRTRWRPKQGRYDSATTATLRAAFGWNAANLACELFGWRYPNNYLRVRYEDLAGAPRQVIEEIYRRVGLSSPADSNEPHNNRHQLYGNRMRFKQVSVSDLKEDIVWKTAMPKGYRWLVGSLCWPFLSRYDYGAIGNPAPAKKWESDA